MSIPTKEEFLYSVQDHELIINLDQDNFRDITLRNPESNDKIFHISSRPYYLTICGDMGTFVFSRSEDMFRFFRNDDLGIQPCYYHEKLQSVDKICKSLEFDCDSIIDRLNEYLEMFEENSNEYIGETIYDTQEYCPETAKQAIDRFIKYTERSEVEYVYEINNWDSDASGGMELTDFWDGFSGMGYTYHYIWCLYAITYAIKLYDESKADDYI